jgi:DNA-binding transcriptional MocR family regulator
MGRQSQYDEKRDVIIAAITELTQTRGGKGPAVREISAKTGISVSSLHSYLNRLKAEGVIEAHERSHRSIKLTGQAPAVVPQGQAPAPVPVATPAPAVPVDDDLDVGF